MKAHSVAQRTVLVTGGAGYIGSHLCRALAAAGYLPVAYDSLSSGYARAVRWGPLEMADILDEGRLAAVLARYRPLAVFHLAGLASVAESLERPDVYFRVNTEGTRRVAAAAVAAGTRFLVFSSSCAVYGGTAELPFREETPTAPLSPYGQSKLAAEELLGGVGQADGLVCVVLRYFNAAGAEPREAIGEARHSPIRALPLAVLAALGRGPAFHVYGSDYPTADGTAVRDYVHVGDLASAHLLALHHLVQGGAGGIFNLGTGRAYSVLELLAAVGKVTGRAVPYRLLSRRAGDPAAAYAAGRKARTQLGWLPRRSDLEQMVADTARWIADDGPESLRGEPVA
jgi:UDP-glucose-4-epimerase GalE